MCRRATRYSAELSSRAGQHGTPLKKAGPILLKVTEKSQGSRDAPTCGPASQSQSAEWGTLSSIDPLGTFLRPAVITQLLDVVRLWHFWWQMLIIFAPLASPITSIASDTFCMAACKELMCVRVRVCGSRLDGHWNDLDDGMWLSLWYPSGGYCLFEGVGDSSAAGSIYVQCLGAFHLPGDW
ncbi:hypothetical protein CYMTET_49046 [Cymbomonas tetramitiformis]|uniref:Uncharacterized protein n=1 Tax=Cymbomonas tetramitiformis TaxID=36881 RepID=A0AAE0BR32_9CHLO|nr:hypothetical protein CYMTET_49046 [Cymbomonas tetramitiformis]